MNCICNEAHDHLGETMWHRAYCAWYDADRAGRFVRAAVAGWVADRLARFA